MNNKIVLGILLALVVISSGCASQESPKDPVKTEGNTIKTVDTEYGTVKKVEIDGTDCYLYTVGSGAGIDCIPTR